LLLLEDNEGVSESEDERLLLDKVYKEINKEQLLHEEINARQVLILRAAVYKMGKDKNAY